jgi:hypothetical protein
MTAVSAGAASPTEHSAGDAGITSLNACSSLGFLSGKQTASLAVTWDVFLSQITICTSEAGTSNFSCLLAHEPFKSSHSSQLPRGWERKPKRLAFSNHPIFTFFWSLKHDFILITILYEMLSGCQK